MLVSQGLPMPPAQAAADVDIDAQSVASLAETEFEHPYKPYDLLYAFAGLLKVAPQLRPQLEPAFDHDHEDAPGDDDLFDLMCTFGRFCMPGEPIRPGDIVGASGDWVLAAGPAAGVGVHNNRTRYEMVEIGDVAEHWRPGYGLVIDPASPVGRYWGPGMNRWRWVLWMMHGGAYFADAFIADVVAPTTLPVEREALLRTLALETQAVDETPVIRPGTILLDDDPDRAALVITDTGVCRAAGTRKGPDFYRMDIESAGCRWLWVPHMA